MNELISVLSWNVVNTNWALFTKEHKSPLPSQPKLRTAESYLVGTVLFEQPHTQNGIVMAQPDLIVTSTPSIDDRRGTTSRRSQGLGEEGGASQIPLQIPLK